MSRFVSSAGEHFGTVVGTRQAGDFLFRLSRYPAGLHLPDHHHAGAYFSFVVRGRLAERLGAARELYAPGSVHFHPSEESHTGEIGPDGLACLSIVPQGELSHAAARARRRPHAAMPALAARCYRAFRDADTTSALSLEAGALELIAALLRASAVDGPAGLLSPMPAAAPGGMPAWVGAVSEHLRRHYARGVSLAELAELAGVHRVHLVRGFRRCIGMTPGAFQRRLRLEHARRALERSDQPIVDIALETGFASQAHLTRWFHRECGLPPHAYRRAHHRRPG